MHEAVLKFWFEEIDSASWWKKDAKFDLTIAERFGDLHTKAKRCELFSWRTSPRGRLAEIIVLDQFSRNIYRNTAQAFSQDTLALALSQEAINQGNDESLDASQRAFLYMPFMHSESQAIHEIAEDLYQRLGNESNYEFELKHKAIIDKFGRYPHRNAILGRESTEEETVFLQQEGSSF